jgi:hypothetical protein
MVRFVDMGVRCNGRLSDARQIIFAKSTNSITPPWEALIRNHYSSLLTQTFALLRTRTQQQLEAPILNRYHSCSTINDINNSMPSTTAPSKSTGGSSVFDRLYSKSTESSRVRKTVAPVTDSNILIRHDDKKPAAASTSLQKKIRPKTTNRPKNVRTVAPSSSGSTGIHDRLYSKGTASYNSKRKAAGKESTSTVAHARGPLHTKTNA